MSVLTPNAHAAAETVLDARGEGGGRETDVTAGREDYVYKGMGGMEANEAAAEEAAMEINADEEEQGTEEVDVMVMNMMEEEQGREQENRLTLCQRLPALFLQDASEHHLQGLKIGGGAGGLGVGPQNLGRRGVFVEPPQATPLKDAIARQYPQDDSTPLRAGMWSPPPPEKDLKDSVMSPVLDSFVAVPGGQTSSALGGVGPVEREVGLSLVSTNVLEVSGEDECAVDAMSPAVDATSPGREEAAGPQVETETETETESDSDEHPDAHFAPKSSLLQVSQLGEDMPNGEKAVSHRNAARTCGDTHEDTGSDADVDEEEGDNRIDEGGLEDGHDNESAGWQKTQDSFARGCRQNNHDFETSACSPYELHISFAPSERAGSQLGVRRRSVGCMWTHLGVSTAAGDATGAPSSRSSPRGGRGWASASPTSRSGGGWDGGGDEGLGACGTGWEFPGTRVAKGGNRGLEPVRSTNDAALSPLDKMLCERAVLLRMDKGQQVRMFCST